MDHDRIDQLLSKSVPDADDRRFVIRCLLDEGPAHHRGANWVLLTLLGKLVDFAGATVHQGSDDDGDDGEHVPVPLRLPPHLRGAVAVDDEFFPLAFPVRPLRAIANGDARAVEAMVACLTDGPPQHALANAAMVILIDAVLRR